MGGYVNPKLVANFEWVESQLEGKQFLLGDQLTGADSTFLKLFLFYKSKNDEIDEKYVAI
jgi:glutathione S-transferase